MAEVWLVNHYAITPDMPGGTRHYDLGVELVRRGFRVRVFAAAPSTADRAAQAIPLYTTQAVDGVEFVWVRSFAYAANNWRRSVNMLLFAFNFLRVARVISRTSRPDVVVGSSPHPFAAWAAERAAARSGARFVLELRDLWPQALLDMSRLSERHPGIIVLRQLEQYLYRKATSIITLAQGSAAYLERRGVPKERIQFLPNGVHLGHFQAREPRTAARRRFGFDRFTIVYAGAHGPANSLETALRAARLVRDLPVAFVLVGKGPSKPQLMQMAQAEGLENVRFLDPIPKSDIADLLQAADAGLITLLNAKAFSYGVSPNKLFDYMAAGLPVLCAVPGEMAELVRAAGAGLVCEPENPEALAAAVRSLAHLPADERERMGQSGRRYSAAFFSREALADRLARVLSAAEPEAADPGAAQRVYLSAPHMSGREERFVQEALRTNWVAPLGPHVDAFEREFCAAVGGAHALAVSSGTAALHLALQHLGVSPGDEVLVSTLTFAASVYPIAYLGARPVFIDSERTSWNMDPDLLAPALARRAASGRLPRAVVLVHLYGQSADVDPIRAECERYGIPLVEDAAEALGATYKGRTPGTLGAAGIYSFNGNKIITTAGGGMLLSPDPTLIAHARKLATQARDPAPHYQHSEIGYNYRMSNVLAGIGRGQLPVLAERVRARRRNFEYYRQELGDLPGLAFQPEAPWGRHTRWLTCLTIDPAAFGADRERIRLALAAEEVESRPVWKPLHLQPVFAGCDRVGGEVAADLFERGLCLPSGSSLTRAELDRVVTVIRRVARRLG